jgi:hypothetical protein
MTYIKEVGLTIYEILFRVDEPLHQNNAMMLIEIKTPMRINQNVELFYGMLSLEVIQADLYNKSTNRFIFIYIDSDVA